jgi:nicotinamidase-related amidase
MGLKDKKPALLIIDVQKGFDNEAHWGGNRNNRNMESNISRLLSSWRKSSLPVIHIKHNSKICDSPLFPANPGNAIKEEAEPIEGEMVIVKSVNSAFIGTDLENVLKYQGISTVVITGLQTDHCISTTARMAANLSFETYIVSDATATFDRAGINGDFIDAAVIHNINLASLNGEFATVADTDAIIANLK